MSRRTVAVTKPSKLDFSMGYMTVRYDEIEKIYKTLKLYHINVLVITSSKPKKISGFEEIHIIDYDLCLIDTCDN